LKKTLSLKTIKKNARTFYDSMIDEKAKPPELGHLIWLLKYGVLFLLHRFIKKG